MKKKIKTMTSTLIGYDVEGEATLSMWGGGEGTINMKKTRLPVEHFSKDNAIRCVNDHGFGCESIESARIEVTERFSNGGYGKCIEFETDSKNSRSLFLGWRHLRDIGAIK